MAKEIGDDIYFQRTVEIARWIEMICGQERGPLFDKMPHHFGGFKGASSGGRGTFGIGHPLRPLQLELQAFHGALGSRGPYVSRHVQLAYTAPPPPISALRSRVIKVVIQVDKASSRVSSHSS